MNMVNIVASRHYTELLSTHEELRQHLLQVEEFAAVQERRRIAREIHDSLGNALTSLNIQLQTALKLWRIDPSEAERFLTEAQKLGAVAIREVRESVYALRAKEGQQQSLEELITCVVENFHQTTGILPSTSISLSVSLPIKVVTTIYRIVQESLTNICKYAQATKVQIIVDANSNNVRLVIKDNGKGFSQSQSKPGFGIQGMKERVTALQGKFKIETESGIGCKITVEIPLGKLPILETKTPKICQESTTNPEDHQRNNSPQKEIFIRQCEQKLAELIGPIASFLVQKAIKNNPHVSCTEFVKILAAEIPNSQKSQSFQQHLFSDLNQVACAELGDG
ncbi:two-component sensor histidine kinase [Fischerella thermalis CCMEE 5205]|nr:two-component sensor histidine kinase [Fischerella thermalis CCMEE 5205]